ncbi:MAG: DUF1573 domain-containing protein [Planctomycetaceae bacterium]|nr:DUF1573 domain-containing protein [Planctomycetaceae bacterium]
MKHLISKWLLGTVVLLGIAQGILIYYVLRLCTMQPVLQIDKTEIDFGVIPSGVKVTQGFRLTNTGNSVLIINKLYTGCGCTEVKLSRNKIEPGKSETLFVTMELEGYGQKTNIYIFSNDPQKAILPLSVKAEPTLQSVIEPDIIDFGQIESNELPVSKSIKFLLNSQRFIGTDLTHLSFTTDESYLVIDDSKLPESNTKQIIISLQKNTPLGDIFTDLHVDDGDKTTTVKILGNVRGPYYALPQTLLIGPVSDSDNTISKSIVLKMRGGDTEINFLEIITLDLSDSLKDLLIVSQEKPAAISVVMHPSLYTGVWSSHKIYGTIRVKCNSHNTLPHEVNIPVLVTLKVPKIKDR